MMSQAASQMVILIEACFCCSVTKSYLSLCNPMGGSMPGFAVLVEEVEKLPPLVQCSTNDLPSSSTPL